MKRYRVVQAGCGGMGHAWIDIANKRDDLELVGLVDLNRAAAESSAGSHGLPQSVVFDTLDQAFSIAKPDLVLDITVPAAHYDVTMSAFRAGCHVLSEKPLADSLQRAKQMVSAAQDSGRFYAIMQNRRYIPQIRGLRAGIESGIIGNVSTVNADFYIGAHFGGFRDLMDSPLLVDMAIHTFDQARFISGSDPVAVYCHEYNPEGSWYKGNASAICIFEMTDGMVFSYRGSWCAEGLNTAWESNWRIVGSKGSARWDGANHPDAEVVTVAEGFHYQHETALMPEVRMDFTHHEGCIDAMMKALHEGKPAETAGADNIKSLAMVFAAVESAKTKQRVEIAI